MKKYPLIFLVFISLGLSFESIAQIDSLAIEKESRFSKIKGYVAGVYEGASVSSSHTSSFGFQAGIIVKNHLQLGFYNLSHGSNNYRQQLIFPNTFEMNYKHAGLLLGYRTYFDKNFEFNVESKWGFGEVKWDQVETGSAFLADKFHMIHLQVSMDYMLAKFLVLNAFFGHRWMNGLDITGLSSDDFNGLFYGVTVKVGKFK